MSSSLARYSVDPGRNPWELYDRLIAGIPEDVPALDWCLGSHWSYVECEVGLGVARTVHGGATGRGTPGFLRDFKPGDPVTLRELAGFSRSWVFEEATLGVAALTSWYNHPAVTPGIVSTDVSVNRSLMEAVDGEKVAFIGHFRNVENYSDTCELTILERSPLGNDLPDPACEYVLPQQDLVIMTGLTLTNKTIVRLLELCRSAKVAISGPSAVCSNALGEYGVDIIGGIEVLDIEAMKYSLSNPSDGKFGAAARKITLEPSA